jgi:hypothetical protein
LDKYTKRFPKVKVNTSALDGPYPGSLVSLKLVY